MAVGHFTYNKSLPHGHLLHAAVNGLETGVGNLDRTVAALIQMKDSGNLTAYAVEKYGFTDVTTATAALAELEAAKGALDGIAATLNQLFAKFNNG